MSQMQQNEGYGYSGYEGGQQYERPQQPYGVPYDDNFVEALAQRVVQRMPVGMQGKLNIASSRPSSGQRLALAIVSLALLVPLAGILFGTLGFLGLIGFCVVCAAVVIVNYIYNTN